MLAQSEVAPLRKTRKVLIIDDEKDICDVAATALEVVAGWQTVKSNSGIQGVADAKRELPDAILLDVQMPGMSGPEVLASLRKGNDVCSIPIVFLTARVQASERARLLDSGAAALLPKPFDPLTLADDLAAALGWLSPNGTLA